MTGLDRPRPGSSAFQRIPSVALHCVGSLVSFDTPMPAEPRNCVASSAAARVASKSDIARVICSRMGFRFQLSSVRRGGSTWFFGDVDDRRRGAEIVADAQLEGPQLGPVLGLLVLAHLDEDFIASLLDRAFADVLVHLESV